MTFSFGAKAPLNFSVFVDAATALVLTKVISGEFFGMNDWFADGAARERESGPLHCKLVKETLNRES